MNESDSVTQWLSGLKEGQESALLKLHNRYRPVVMQLMARRFGSQLSPIADEEDVAQEALHSLFAGIKADEFPRLNDRQDLLALLSIIAVRRATHQFKREQRQKRGSGRTVQASAAAEDYCLLDHISAPNQLDPLEVLAMEETYDRFLKVLPDELRIYAEYYLAGLSTTEIASKTGCVKRTAERKLERAKVIWREASQNWPENEFF